MQPTDPTALREITNHLLHVPPTTAPATIICLMQTSLKETRQVKLYECNVSTTERSFTTKSKTPLNENMYRHSPSWNARLDNTPTQISLSNLKSKAPKRAQPKCANDTIAIPICHHGGKNIRNYLQEILLYWHPRANHQTTCTTMQYAYPKRFKWLRYHCPWAHPGCAPTMHKRTVYHQNSSSFVERQTI